MDRARSQWSEAVGRTRAHEGLARFATKRGRHAHAAKARETAAGYREEAERLWSLMGDEQRAAELVERERIERETAEKLKEYMEQRAHDGREEER